MTNHVSSRKNVEILLAHRDNPLRQPNLNSLKMFDAAARHLNFRLAAEELNLTQGAVAQQVRRLEADLGLALFLRKARGLELTEIGGDYHRRIHRGLVIIEEATRQLLPQNSTITLSITPSFASKWLVPRLAEFNRAYPGIEVRTVASEGIANFHTDGVDIAIRQGQPPFGDELQAQLLAPLDLRAVCNADLAQEIAAVEQVEDFVDYPLIQDSHNLWDKLFAEADIAPAQRPLQFNQTTLAMDAAANGQGIALAPRILLDSDITQGRLVELWQDRRSNQGGYYIVYPVCRSSSSARNALIEWMNNQVGDDS